jgi:GT2 family glycosyltransferase
MLDPAPQTAEPPLPRTAAIGASVIVVVYNSRAYLQPCLQSILEDLGPHGELIVVDNGSTDGSADLVRSRFPNVQLIQAENIGYAGGNNRGVAVAQGEYLVFLNPDTVVHPGALAALLAPLAAQPEIGLTTACIVHLRQPDVINTCGLTMHYTGLTYCRGAGQPRAAYAQSSEVDSVSGAAFAIRRDLFEQLGGFDERFFMYVEDTDLSWRARLAGYSCLYVADAVVSHDYQPSFSPAKSFYLDRNRHLMLLKNLRRSTYQRMLPALLFAEAVTWGFMLLKGPRFWVVKPRVYRALWRERSVIRALHRQAHLQRSIDRILVTRMTYRLEFDQLASRQLARIAGLVFHPAFRLARLLFAGVRG